MAPNTLFKLILASIAVILTLFSQRCTSLNGIVLDNGNYIGILSIDSTLTWFEAAQYCLDLGTTLGSIHSQSDNNNAVSLIESLESQEPSDDDLGYHIWIGLTDYYTEDSFFWLDGSGSVFDGYSNWHDGEPNDFGSTGEDCVIIHRQNNHEWEDRPCDSDAQYYAFVCNSIAYTQNIYNEITTVDLDTFADDCINYNNMYNNCSNSGTIFDNLNDYDVIICDETNTCNNTVIIGSDYDVVDKLETYLFCIGKNVCQYINVTNVSYMQCNGLNACNHANLVFVKQIECLDQHNSECQDMIVYGSETIAAGSGKNGKHDLRRTVITSGGGGGGGGNEMRVWSKDDVSSLKVTCGINDTCWLNPGSRFNIKNLDCFGSCYIDSDSVPLSIQFGSNTNCFNWYYNLLPSLLIVTLQVLIGFYLNTIWVLHKCIKEIDKCFFTMIPWSDSDSKNSNNFNKNNNSNDNNDTFANKELNGQTAQSKKFSDSQAPMLRRIRKLQLNSNVFVAVNDVIVAQWYKKALIYAVNTYAYNNNGSSGISLLIPDEVVDEIWSFVYQQDMMNYIHTGLLEVDDHEAIPMKELIGTNMTTVGGGIFILTGKSEVAQSEQYIAMHMHYMRTILRPMINKMIFIPKFEYKINYKHIFYGYCLYIVIVNILSVVSGGSQFAQWENNLTQHVGINNNNKTSYYTIKNDVNDHNNNNNGGTIYYKFSSNDEWQGIIVSIFVNFPIFMKHFMILVIIRFGYIEKNKEILFKNIHNRFDKLFHCLNWFDFCLFLIGGMFILAMVCWFFYVYIPIVIMIVSWVIGIYWIKLIKNVNATKEMNQQTIRKIIGVILVAWLIINLNYFSFQTALQRSVYFDKHIHHSTVYVDALLQYNKVELCNNENILLFPNQVNWQSIIIWINWWTV